jgi:hypothetical protein
MPLRAHYEQEKNMSLDRMLTASNVKTDDDGFIATGPLATEAKQDAIIAAQASAAGQLGTGLPIPMTFADPGSDAYTAAQATTRAATRIRVIVANSGVVISLDNGVTGGITLMPNMADDVPVDIPLGTLIKVKRFTAGTAFTNLVLEVR